MPKVKAKAEEEKEEAENVMDAARKGISTEIAPRILIKGRRASDRIRILAMEARVPTMAAKHPPGTKVLSDRRNNNNNMAKVGISNSSQIGVSNSSSPRAAGRARAQVTFIS
jgi:hypothetical protein